MQTSIHHTQEDILAMRRLMINEVAYSYPCHDDVIETINEMTDYQIIKWHEAFTANKED